MLHTYGERKGGLAAELWKLLQVLGGFDRPMYRGNQWVVNGRDRGSDLPSNSLRQEEH